MSAKTENLEGSTSVQVFLPRTEDKKLAERNLLFGKMKTLIEKDKEALALKKITYKKNMVFLDMDDFGSIISFQKPISLYIGAGKDFDKNKDRIKDLANKAINYINTVLGDLAKGAKVSSMLTFPSKTGIDLAKKIVEETKLAKINEIAKRTLHPIGIMFAFTSKGHDNMITYLHSENGTVTMVTSRSEFKDMVAWDFFEEEFKNLKESVDIIGKLAQQEF